MADLPITFSAPMVQALIREIVAPGTGKTQTRRTHPPEPRFTPDGCGQPDLGGRPCWWDFWASDRGEVQRFKLPYAVGDRLYVREHWRCSAKHDATAPRDLEPRSMTIAFEAGGSIANQDNRDDWRPSDVSYTEAEWMGRFRQGMHMPRWASRITLIVTDVTVQRLQGISEEDARAEGVKEGDWPDRPECSCDDDDCLACSHYPALYKPAFRHLWNSLHGPDAWDRNTWVAAYTFRPIHGNIDKIKEGGTACARL